MDQTRFSNPFCGSPNHPFQFTAIISLPLELQMMLSRNNVLDPCKCDPFGLQIKFHESNTLFNDTPVKKILLNKTLSIIWLCNKPEYENIIALKITPQPICLEPLIQVLRKDALEQMTNGIVSILLCLYFQ